MGCINTAGIGGSQDANGAIDEMGVLGHGSFLFRQGFADKTRFQVPQDTSIM
jgi:hypothetical protein